MLKQVYENFKFPFTPHGYQVDVFNEAIKHNKFGLWLGVGTGKTFVSTAVALHHSLENDVETIMFVVPPSLVYQWGDWLKGIKFIDGDDIEVTVYKGSPAERKKMSFNTDMLVMSHNIFRQDYERILKELGKNRKVCVVYDEAHAGLRKPGNRIWRFLKNFTQNKQLLLLTATPVGNPMDAYGIIKLLDPNCYPTKRFFEAKHVAKTDFFGNITHWKNLQDMHHNLYAHAYKLETNEVMELPPAVHSQIKYELTPKHKKLYDKLAQEEMLELEDGAILDGTNASRLFHLLQRFVTCPDKLDVKKVQAALFELIQTLYEEDDSKLIIYANYKNTNTGIFEYLNKKGIQTVGCWGDISRANQHKSIKAFQEDPDVRVLTGNPVSLGVGIDGLQDVCHRIIFAELPLASREFYQSVGRIDRQRQTKSCTIRVLTAAGTIQENLYHSLMRKDDIVNEIVKNRNRLRDYFK